MAELTYKYFLSEKGIQRIISNMKQRDSELTP
jgi:hypothetical protein